ncbi:UNVERIFIED_CONTAM: hypothetical protein Slati_1509700 [Sesamum latifolium]|uniref:Reverse transcriptase zinc-binding domain-containing protein n=1 Tax=Sesamum latifolium TaxID=2727402 RepID=A0AAW2X6N8_9LAMI
MEHREITHQLPVLMELDNISWNSPTGQFTSAAAYRIWQPPRPKVLWHHLLMGSLRIPRNSFILWLAILGRLSTLDRAWWQGSDRICVLCTKGEQESHNHLFFDCEFSRQCLRILRLEVRFYFPRVTWMGVIEWASWRWRSRHPFNEVQKTLFSSLVYHI